MRCRARQWPAESAQRMARWPAAHGTPGHRLARIAHSPAKASHSMLKALDRDMQEQVQALPACAINSQQRARTAWEAGSCKSRCHRHCTKKVCSTLQQCAEADAKTLTYSQSMPRFKFKPAASSYLLTARPHAIHQALTPTLPGPVNTRQQARTGLP